MTRRYPCIQVDAFTQTPLAGNPCAVVFDADDLDEATMQKIAQEMNLSETAFVLRSTVADVRARYFTPAEEIPLAGHPTVATLFALFNSGRLSPKGPVTAVSLELRDGPIAVAVHTDQDRVSKVVMTQRKPAFMSTFSAEDVLPAFGLEPQAAADHVPIQTVSTGTPQLMVLLKSQSDLRRATLNVPVYRALKDRADFFSPHLFCLEGFTDAGTTSARHFGVPPDTMEDPFTGSATGGMAAFLWHHRCLERPEFIAEQGHDMGRPGQASVRVIGPSTAIEAVEVGGPAVEVIRGTLCVP